MHVIEGFGEPSFEPVSMVVRFGDLEFAVDRVFHPEYHIGLRNDGSPVLEPDLAMVHLVRPVDGIEPSPIYTWDDETGLPVVFVGYGRFGFGDVGQGGEYGTLRAATNTVTDTNEDWIRVVFDKGEAATELEGVSAGGDSGGPAFIHRGRRDYVAGVSSHSNPVGSPEVSPATYGVHEAYTRVSSQAEWIGQVMVAIDDDGSHPSAVTPSELSPHDASDGLPDSPAGRAAQDYFDAFNSGEAQQFIDWNNTYYEYPEPEESNAARFARYTKKYGKYIPKQYASLSETSILVLVETKTGVREEMRLDVFPEDVGHIDLFGFRTLKR
ncbi:MAG: hypothetical protein ACI89L_001928 [Phycisphaerales bacterium]|jgi:hypothetical protein